MNSDYGIDNIWTDNVIDTLKDLKICPLDDKGQYRSLSSVLREVSQRINDITRPTLPYCVVTTIDEFVSNTSEELDSFLNSFKITDKEVHYHR